MSVALCTLPTVKALMGIATSDDDARLGILIGAASDAIERDCDRLLAARNISEWRDGTGTPDIILPEWPLNSVSRVTIGTLDAITVVNNDPLATEAFARVTNTTLEVIILDGANAGTDSVTLGTKTIDTVIAEVNALGKGWAGNALSDYGGYRASTLRRAGRRECYGSFCYFQIPDEGEADYITEYDTGIIHLTGGLFPRGRQNIYIEYNAGYDPIPGTPQRICADLVADAYYAHQSAPNKKKEQLGDYMYELESRPGWSVTSKDIQHRLAPFKNQL